MNKLELRDVQSGYGHPVLRNISFAVRQGEFVGVVGPNGAGKSTLIKTITRILPLQQGDIWIDGININNMNSRELARRAAVVGQSFGVSFDYRVIDVVRMGRYAHQDKSVAAIRPYMEWTGVWQFRDRSFHNLSGGEQQRVIISQALAQEASLLLLDEPTSDLDIHHQVEIFDLIEKLRCEKNLTILAVLHDLNLASLYCDRIVVIKDGTVWFDGLPQDIISADNIKKIYGVDVSIVTDADTGRPIVVVKRNSGSFCKRRE